MHEITVNNGKAEAVYANGKPAWHGLGTVVEGALTSGEALEKGGLNWEVGIQPAYHLINPKAENKEFQPVSDRFVTFREDNKQPLGIVSNRYKIVQNRSAFSFLDQLVTVGNLEYESAGSLKGGKKVWMMARFPNEVAIAPDDVNYNYLAIFNSHDGSTPVMIIPTTVRIVCWNTLQVAMNQAKRNNALIRMRHTTNIMMKMDDVRQALGLYSQVLQNVNIIYEELAKKQVTQQNYLNYIDNMFPLPTVKNDDNKIKYNRVEKIRDQIEYNFRTDPRQKTSATNNTAYGLFNAVSQYVDHERITKGKAETTKISNRFESSWLGSGHDIKQSALKNAVNLFL